MRSKQPRNYDDDENEDYIRQSLDRRMSGGRDYGGEYRRRGLNVADSEEAVGGISAGYRGMYDERDMNYGGDFSGRGRFDDHDLPDSRDMESNDYGSRRRMQPRRGQHTGKGPKGYQRSDERIHEEVCDVLTDHGDIDASDIEITVTNGEVTLSGFVENRRIKRMAEDALDHVRGVKDVQNRLRIRPTQDYTGSTPTDELSKKGDMDNALIQNQMHQTTLTGQSQASPINKSSNQG